MKSFLLNVLYQPPLLCLDLMHTAFKWHLADWQYINERMPCLSSWFISNCSIETEIQELWNIFKNECHKCLQPIPYKPFMD